MDLLEQIARALCRIDVHHGDVEHVVQQRVDAEWRDYAKQAQAVLPFIAAETERCARVAEELGGDRVERGADGLPRAYDHHSSVGRGDAILNAQRVRAQSIAAAIRSKP